MQPVATMLPWCLPWWNLYQSDKVPRVQRNIGDYSTTPHLHRVVPRKLIFNSSDLLTSYNYDTLWILNHLPTLNHLLTYSLTPRLMRSLTKPLTQIPNTKSLARWTWIQGQISARYVTREQQRAAKQDCVLIVASRIEAQDYSSGAMGTGYN